MKAFKRPLIALVLSLILMQVSEQFSLRFDLTVDKRYSLSEAISSIKQSRQAATYRCFFDW